MGLQAKQSVCLLHASGAQCTSDSIESQLLSFFKLFFKLSLKYIRGLCRYSFVDHVLPTKQGPVTVETVDLGFL